jgi:hypothetical protein
MLVFHTVIFAEGEKKFLWVDYSKTGKTIYPDRFKGVLVLISNF